MTRSFLMAFFFAFAFTVFCIKERPWNRVAWNSCDAPDDFKKFQKQYLIILGLVQSADWLQGPYVYALYQYYNFSIEQIALLFVVGYGAAGTQGVFVGALADKLGRKKACLAYAVICGASCVTKHFPIYAVLLVGRYLSGTASALLHSAFESWMITHHRANDWGENLLETTFTYSGQVKGITAVIAGLVASTVVDNFGPVAAFDAAIYVLIISIYFISKIDENYGNVNQHVRQSVFAGFRYLYRNPTVLALGLSESFFGAAMYMFVFVWTPSLQAVNFDKEDIAFGLVFSSFMVGCILGSTLYGIAIARDSIPEVLALCNFLAALVTLGASTFPNFYTRFLSFVTFEICIGWFWANAMSIRGKYISEELRTTIMNLFRVPLNIMVVTVLLNLKHVGVDKILISCVGFIASAACCQLLVLVRRRNNMYEKLSGEASDSFPTIGDRTVDTML